MEDVMFGDKVSCTGVKTAGEEAAHDEIPERIQTTQLHKRIIEDDLYCNIKKVRPGEREVVYEHWTDRVEEYLEGAEEGFAEDGGEEDGFERRRQICVKPINTERFVMGEMVRLYDHRQLEYVGHVKVRLRTLNDALYGIPIGRFANIASRRFAKPDLKAKLCDISWMARKRF